MRIETKEKIRQERKRRYRENLKNWAYWNLGIGALSLGALVINAFYQFFLFPFSWTELVGHLGLLGMPCFLIVSAIEGYKMRAKTEDEAR